MKNILAKVRCLSPYCFYSHFFKMIPSQNFSKMLFHIYPQKRLIGALRHPRMNLDQEAKNKHIKICTLKQVCSY